MAGCHTSDSFLPVSEVSPSLDDCTVEEADALQNPGVALPALERVQILQAATLWATQNGYFPCQIDMCGAIYGHNGKTVSVYVTAAAHIKQSAVAAGRLFQGPDAEVTFSLPNFRVVGQSYIHAQCRARPNNSFKPKPLRGSA
jgi:hypothetical protein